jgi:two-component system sensor histidine kinase UhpB
MNMNTRRRLSLHTRISLLLTTLAAALLLVLGGLWLHGVRGAIHEEVEAATRVSEQWLAALVGEERGAPRAGAADRLLGHLRSLGRIRANVLEVASASGERLYVSPPPSYKSGRAAPEWFAALVEPRFAPRRIEVDGADRLVLHLHPDPSRAVLDAWDELGAMAGWAAALLGLLFVAVRQALTQALRPVGQVVAALDRTARGGADFRVDARLPASDAPELDRVARAFNGMADRLAQAVDENVRLESEREIARRMQAGLEDERRGIARELHDELAQGITAVRALAGAIVQRCEGLSGQPALLGSAQNIIAVTGEMQDGVRAILQRLRPAAAGGLAAVLHRHCAGWRQQHPGIELAFACRLGQEALSDATAQAVLRTVQEGLTNIARHADASRVDIELAVADGWLEMCIADNGRGLAGGPSRQPGCGLGLAGMSERVAALGGEIRFGSRLGGGARLVVRLPVSLFGAPVAQH